MKQELDAPSSQNIKLRKLPKGTSDTDTQVKMIQITATFPMNLLVELKQLGLKRRVEAHKNTTVSAMLREAATNLIKTAP